MKIVTYGEIMDAGSSVFIAVAQLDGKHLIVSFKGVIRVENPYKHLAEYIEDLEKKLTDIQVNKVTINFLEFKYCNSNGFYVLMDMIEIIYKVSVGDVVIRRLKEDDWQQETLPILLNYDEKEIQQRTKIEDITDN